MFSHHPLLSGAALFDVRAPQEAKPQLGAMSGWDDAFDRKFDSAVDGAAVGARGASAPGAAAAAFGAGDPFAGTGAGYMAGAQGFGQDSFDPNAPKPIGDMNNPFLATGNEVPFSQQTNPEADLDSPLFDDDTSHPLEPFPRLTCDADGWEMFIRHPPKKKLTAQR